MHFLALDQVELKIKHDLYLLQLVATICGSGGTSQPQASEHPATQVSMSNIPLYSNKIKPIIE